MAKKKNKEVTPFQVMTSILNNFTPTKEQKNSINSFFFVRWLSNNPQSIHLGNVFNRYHKEIPLFIQYDIAKQILQNKIKFISFPKKELEDEKILKNISKYYKVSLSTAEEYYSIMNKEEKEKFEKLYDGA
jgi:hypothetical protein